MFKTVLDIGELNLIGESCIEVQELDLTNSL